MTKTTNIGIFFALSGEITCTYLEKEGSIVRYTECSLYQYIVVWEAFNTCGRLFKPSAIKMCGKYQRATK